MPASRSRPRIALFWLLAAAALLLRAGIPSGWMPQADAGGIRIALCTGNGAVMATLGADGKVHRDAPAPTAPRDPCPFGLAAAQAADVPVGPVLAPARIAEWALPAVDRASAARSILKHARPPARGPPDLT